MFCGMNILCYIIKKICKAGWGSTTGGNLKEFYMNQKLKIWKVNNKSGRILFIAVE